MHLVDWAAHFVDFIDLEQHPLITTILVHLKLSKSVLFLSFR